MPEIYCKICGNMARPGDRFCRKCGASLSSSFATGSGSQGLLPALRCPDCEGAISAEDLNCPHCGVSLGERIPHDPGKQVTQDTVSGKFIGPKKRHGCLTIYLILMIFGIFSNIVNSIQPLQTASAAVRLVSIIWLVFASLANLVVVIAIARWKKWGFWLAFGISVVAFTLEILIGSWSAIFSLTSVGIFYLVLHIGVENKAWPQLE